MFNKTEERFNKRGTFGLTFEMIFPRDRSEDLTDYEMRQLLAHPQEGRRNPKDTNQKRKKIRKSQRKARKGNR